MFKAIITSIKEWFNAVKENKRLREENDRLRQRVAHSQEIINRTNAYWKGKMRNTKPKKVA